MATGAGFKILYRLFLDFWLTSDFVVPVKAGNSVVGPKSLDPGLRGDDEPTQAVPR